LKWIDFRAQTFHFMHSPKMQRRLLLTLASVLATSQGERRDG